MKGNPAYGDSALRLSVVVPVYNEARTVGSVLESLLALEAACPEKEILVVDDGSTDETRAEVKRIAGQRDGLQALWVLTKCRVLPRRCLRQEPAP
jgi:glycosyltransferase involved in cell wall biosynthesis